jgi:hypothetical protein
MSPESREVTAARTLATQLATTLGKAPSFQQLNPKTQSAILRDLSTIQTALGPASSSSADPYAFTLETPEDFARRRAQARRGIQEPAPADQPSAAPTNGATPAPRAAATETLARRAGALSDEIDFPGFVAGLIHGTFDAIVDASIRQMEAFADLVSAVAKDTEQFTRDNISANQARDWLAERYPKDLVLDLSGGPRLLPRQSASDSDEEPPSPDWLADFGLDDEPLTAELIEEQLIPAARRHVGEDRLQMLATMVLLGMNRVIVRDGSISARVRFRAVARDKAAVDYAVAQDPGGSAWGQRGNATYAQHSTMISTVGVNVQAETELKAELFGEVKINFASETLPLERFADQARVTLLQRNARPPGSAAASSATPPPEPAPASSAPPAASPAPATPPPAGGGGR